MKKIFKENIISIIALAILLIAESVLLLYLPNYIKGTISYSIDSSGIESYIPEIISNRSMNSFTAIMQNEDIKEYYELIKKNDDNYVEKYEILNSQDIYILKDINKDEKKKVSELLLKATSLYTMFNQSEELKNMDFRPDATVINYYMGLTDDNEIKNIYNSYESLDKSKKEDYAIAFVLEEYKALQLNLKNMQKEYLYKKILNIVFIFVITLVLIVISNNLSRKLANKIVGENKKLNKLKLLNILREGIFIPIIAIGSILSIVILNWKWLIGELITIIMIILIVSLLKHKLSIKEAIYQKIKVLIKPLILLIITTMGIITILTIPENINIANNITLASYTLEIAMITIIVALTYKLPNRKKM